MEAIIQQMLPLAHRETATLCSFVALASCGVIVLYRVATFIARERTAPSISALPQKDF